MVEMCDKTQICVWLLLLVLLPRCLGAASEESNRFPPPCMISCLDSVVANTSCIPTDVKCLCSYTALRNIVSRCMQASCTLSTALYAENITHTACNASIRDRSAQYNDAIIPLGVVTILVTSVRLIFKQSFGPAKSLGTDDWAIMSAMVVCISGLLIGVYGLTAHGLGRDVWTLTTAELSKFVFYLYVMEILYLTGISLVKLSFSFFYLQLFSSPIVLILLRATVVFNALYGLIFTIGAVFQCSPVHYYWNQYDGDSQGHCVNINLFGWFNAAIGVAIDFWMIVLPLSQVLPLKIHWKDKFGVIVMFLLGTLATVVSVLRLHSLIYFANSSNPTWDQWTTVYWSVIEINVGMICSCLPSLRLISCRLFPCFRASSSNTTVSRQEYVYGDRNAYRSDFQPNEEKNPLKMKNGSYELSPWSTF